LQTGVEEIDRVFGGGLVDGSFVLIGGEPGIGKSTIVAQIANAIGKQHLVVLCQWRRINCASKRTFQSSRL
jgi:DNA repair protein RadA/Sms